MNAIQNRHQQTTHEASTMFIYQTGPIDFFAPMMRIDEAAKAMRDEEGVDDGRSTFNLFRFAMDCAAMVYHADGSYWERDVRGDNLYVFAIPCEGSPQLGLVWKQDNNGTTFICSPVVLPWLHGDALNMAAKAAAKLGVASV
jgi:hypothetical protein